MFRLGVRQGFTSFPNLRQLFIYNDIKLDIGEGSSKYIAHITETPHGLQKAKIVYRYKSTSPNGESNLASLHHNILIFIFQASPQQMLLAVDKWKQFHGIWIWYKISVYKESSRFWNVTLVNHASVLQCVIVSNKANIFKFIFSLIFDTSPHSNKTWVHEFDD